MANAKITVEVSQIGAEKAQRALRELRGEGERMSTQSRRMAGTSKEAADAHKTSTRTRQKASRATQGLQGKIQDLNRSVRLALGPLSGVASRIDAVTGLMNSATAKAAAFVGGFIGIGAVIGQSLRQFRQFEEQMLKVAGAIEATGRQSEITTEEVSQFARKLGDETLTSADQVRQAAAAFLTFKDIGTENFQRVLTVAQDMSSVFGGSLRSMIQRLGRTLEDTGSSITRLGRVGGVFTQAQEEIIDVLGETGNKAKRTDMILRILEDRIGGTAKRAAQGFAGSIDSLQENINEIAERIGSSFAPMAESLIDSLVALTENTKAVSRIFGTLAGVFSAIVTGKILGLFGALGAVLGPVVAIVGTLVALFGSWKDKTISIGDTTAQLGQFVVGTFKFIKKRAIEFFRPTAKFIVNLFNRVGRSIQKVTEFFVGSTNDMGRSMKNVETRGISTATKTKFAFMALGNAILQVGKAIGVAIGGAMALVRTSFEELPRALGNTWRALVKGFKLAMAQVGNIAHSQGKAILAALRGDFTAMSAHMANAMSQSADTVKKVMDGMSDEVEGSFSRTRGLIDQIFTDIKDVFGEDLIGEASRDIDRLEKEWKKLVVTTEEFEGMDISMPSARQSVSDIKAVNNALGKFLNKKGAIEGIRNSTENFFMTAIEGSKSFSASLKDLIKDILMLIAKLVVVRPIVDSLVSKLSGLGTSSTPNINTGAGSITQLVSSALGAKKGLAFDQGKVTPMARGGLIEQPTLFNTSSGVGVGGEAGTEAVMPLTRTSGGDLGVKSEGGQEVTNMNVVIDARGADPQAAANLRNTAKQIEESIVARINTGRRK